MRGYGPCPDFRMLRLPDKSFKLRSGPGKSPPDPLLCWLIAGSEDSGALVTQT